MWGDFRRLIFPWDGGRGLTGDDVVPCGAIHEIRIGSYAKDIYGGLVDFLHREGYRTHFFDYDWRADNADSARELAEELREFDAVTLICQSNGTYICRFLVRYLEPVAAIDKVIMVGTANGGAVRILREMNRGRQYIRPFGRRMRPETLFTFRSLFQDLPAVPHGDADVFDAGNWKRYGWSVFAGKVTPDMEDWLRESLANARSFHDLLKSDSGRDLPPYYSIQSRGFDTLSRVVPPDEFAAEEKGDRHATITSQYWLAAEEQDALVEAIYVTGLHFEMITTDETRAHILRIVSGVSASSRAAFPGRRPSRGPRTSAAGTDRR
ncbi:MAG TPA: hypothetical protein VM779_12070 [Thermoanaerobaculia bacterium]|nr:hypothetical protein [Thermoanaerobaculia bacterium]